ncbi:MAG: hypothetical protein NC121_04370 [Blautia sp.]|nr:hypothetical protein [Blautia sp.]
MFQDKFPIPVVLFTFNRPQLVSMQIEILKKVKPCKIFFVSDAARNGREEEKKLVLQTRQLIDRVDWDCEINRYFAERNMGCDSIIVSALNDIFSKVDKAIILEDDCIPCISFFTFCMEMLDRYVNNSEIMYVSGTKWVPQYSMRYSYGFSYNTGTWGWATWKRAWKEWHWDIREWEEKKNDWLSGVYSNRYRKHWIKDMESYICTGNIPWDYVWRFCVGRRLSIFPAVNLISNMGFGEEATHTKEEEYGYSSKTGEIHTIVHPPAIKEDLKYPCAVEKEFKVPLWYRIRRKLRKMGSTDKNS